MLSHTEWSPKPIRWHYLSLTFQSQFHCLLLQKNWTLWKSMHLCGFNELFLAIQRNLLTLQFNWNRLSICYFTDSGHRPLAAFIRRNQNILPFRILYWTIYRWITLKVYHPEFLELSFFLSAVAADKLTSCKQYISVPFLYPFFSIFYVTKKLCILTDFSIPVSNELTACFRNLIGWTMCLNGSPTRPVNVFPAAIL